MAENKAQFDEILAEAPEEVADFSPSQTSLVNIVQHRLHETPSLVPLIVLLLSIAAFGVLLGSKFFSPFALTLILQQVAIVGIVGAAQSLVILTAGIDLSVGAIQGAIVRGHGAVHIPLWIAGRDRDCLWSGMWNFLRLHQRRSGRCYAVAAIYRDVGYVANRSGNKFSLFRQRDHPFAGYCQRGTIAPDVWLEIQNWCR